MAIRTATTSGTPPLRQRALPTALVVCSLEPWGEVRRRMQLLVDELVDLRASIEVLYVDPPGRDGGSIGTERRTPRLRRVHPRIHVLRPHALGGRSLGTLTSRWLDRQVLDAVGELGLHRPILWIDNPVFVSLAEDTGWPFVFDLGDDWRRSSLTDRVRARHESAERILIDGARAVVASSSGPAGSRAAGHAIELIPNGVDVQMFQLPRPRPAELPPAPVALHVGTLLPDRFDVELVLDLAARVPGLRVVLAGPDLLPRRDQARLRAAENVHLLGARPYDQVPALLQHADVLLAPHLVSPFTEGLDPIYAYECRVVGRPTVATPVPGFRGLGPPVVVTTPEGFVPAVERMLAPTGPVVAGTPSDRNVPSWVERAEAMAALLDRITLGRGS